MQHAGYLTVTQLSRKYDAFTEAALRKLICKANVNGLTIAIKRVGRRIYFDEKKFRRWLESR